MNIAVDLGNTFSKIGLFDKEDILLKEESGLLSEAELLDFIHRHKPENVIVGSVGKEVSFIEKACLANTIHCLVLDASTKLPVQNCYQTQQTLGADRLAAVVGATVKFPRRNCLAVDMGTCITYDLVDRGNNYLGGSISPGLHLRLKALNAFTARLPLVEIKQNNATTNDVELTGKTTEGSILSGVIHGTAAEIEGMIGKYANKIRSLQVVICGGDAKFFESKIKAPIFAAPELVLIGLNRILQYNVSNS